MNLSARIFIAFGLCMLIITGCQKSTEQETMILGEVTQQTNSGNENIKRIEITNEVRSIEEGFFLKYNSLEYINVAEDNEYFKSIDGVLYTKDGSAVVAYPIGRAETEYIIPEQCVAIYSYAFAYALVRYTAELLNNCGDFVHCGYVSFVYIVFYK